MNRLTCSMNTIELCKFVTFSNPETAFFVLPKARIRCCLFSKPMSMLVVLKHLVSIIVLLLHYVNFCLSFLAGLLDF